METWIADGRIFWLCPCGALIVWLGIAVVVVNRRINDWQHEADDINQNAQELIAKWKAEQENEQHGTDR